MLSCAIKLISILVVKVYSATLGFLLVIIGLGTSTFLLIPTFLVAVYHLYNMSVPLLHMSLSRSYMLLRGFVWVLGFISCLSTNLLQFMNAFIWQRSSSKSRILFLSLRQMQYLRPNQFLIWHCSPCIAERKDLLSSALSSFWFRKLVICCSFYSIHCRFYLHC